MSININDFSNFDINNFVRDINYLRVMELLEDPDDINDSKIDSINKFKENVINDEILDLNDENILSDIELVLYNMPNDISPKEKVRWVYIGLGNLLSYDYRIADDIKYGIDKVLNLKEYIGRYQTCIQISEIVNFVLNQIDGVESKTIARELKEYRTYGANHVANEVKVKIDDNNYETYLLDLTLDLYLIQSGCKTMHFGYESGPNGEYDIISQNDNYEMDFKLELLNNGGYTNNQIEQIKKILNNTSYSSMTPKEIVDYKIMTISSLIKTFPGYHEGKRYIDMLFDEILQEKYREYNLSSKRDSNTNYKTCYMIERDDYIKWVIYSNRVGFLSTNENGLRNMLENDWDTKSSSLKKMILTKKNIL